MSSFYSLSDEKTNVHSMIFQIYDLLAPLVAKASSASYGAGKAESRNLNMENGLPTTNETPEKAVQYDKYAKITL